MGRLDEMRAAARLLSEAADAGLLVLPDGEHLMIKGPRTAEPLAKALLANKRLLLPLLEDKRFEIVACFGDECRERVLLIDGEGYCRKHSMTITTRKLM